MKTIKNWFLKTDIVPFAALNGFMGGLLVLGSPPLMLMLLCVTLYNYSSLNNIRDMSREQLASIFLITGLYPLIYFNSTIQAIVLSKTRLLAENLHHFDRSYRQALCVGLSATLAILLTPSPHAEIQKIQRRVNLSFLMSLMSGLYALLYVSTHLQGNIGKTLRMFWLQLSSQPLAMQILGDTSLQLLGYPALASLVILLALPVLLWIRVSIELLTLKELMVVVRSMFYFKQ